MSDISSVPPFAELFERLQRDDEGVAIEAKTASDVGKSILSTISAFANEPGLGGGYLLLGVQRTSDGYTVVGIPDPDRMQADLATLCRNEMNVPVNPLIRVEQHAGRAVAVVHIVEAEAHEKPVYIANQGLPRGAYRRLGSTDQRCRDEDLVTLYRARDTRAHDTTMLEGLNFADLSSEAVATYRRRRATRNPDAAELAYTDEDLLRSIGALAPGRTHQVPTVAGLFLFGRREALTRLFPMHRVDYIRVGGTEWVSDPDERYGGNEWREALMSVVDRIITTVMEDIPTRFSLPKGSMYRRDIPLVPLAAVREAIVNALMHRDYAAAETVQIIRFSNRIEIRNPGYSLVPDEDLGDPGSKPRNPTIANVFHDTGLAETKGTGIRTMRQEMRKANLSEPIFISDRRANRFRSVLLLHHLLSESDYNWLTLLAEFNLSDSQAHALAFVRQTGQITNADYRSLTGQDTLGASKQLQLLRELGLLVQRGASSATYYEPGAPLLDAWIHASATGLRRTAADSGIEGEQGSTGAVELPLKTSEDAGEVTPKSSQDYPGLTPEVLRHDPGLTPEVSQHDPGLSPDNSDSEFGADEILEALPRPLMVRVIALEEYARRAKMLDIIQELCSVEPLSPRQIAGLLNRNPDYIRRQFLTPLVRAGRLAYMYPDKPAHPQQMYRAVVKRDE